MGHMILIADEIVKLFEHYPQEIYEAVKSHIPQPGWDNYVNTTLRETRDRDLLPLGGGISLAPADAASIASGLSDEDDEFPMNSSRTMRALDMGGQAGGGAAADEGAFGGHAKASSSNDAGEPGSSDQVRFYARLFVSMLLREADSALPHCSSLATLPTPSQVIDQTSSAAPTRTTTTMRTGWEIRTPSTATLSWAIPPPRRPSLGSTIGSSLQVDRCSALLHQTARM